MEPYTTAVSVGPWGSWRHFTGHRSRTKKLMLGRLQIGRIVEFKNRDWPRNIVMPDGEWRKREQRQAAPFWLFLSDRVPAGFASLESALHIVRETVKL